MSKFTEMCLLLTATTGLTFDDILKEVVAETPEERMAAQVTNTIKMNDFISGKINEKDNSI